MAPPPRCAVPDEDECGQGGFGLPDDPALVDALMGWDGDPCACPDCTCTRFRDSEDARCPDLPGGRSFAGKA